MLSSSEAKPKNTLFQKIPRNHLRKKNNKSNNKNNDSFKHILFANNYKILY